MSLETAPGITVRRIDEARSVFLGKSTMRFVAGGELTANRYGLFECRIPARAGGASPHFHKTFSESFYVVSGQLGIYAGDHWTSCRAGEFAFVPELGVHGYRNDADVETVMLVLFAPAPQRERYFEALARMAADGVRLTGEERTRFLAEHDQYDPTEVS